jgi:carboxylesterase
LKVALMPGASKSMRRSRATDRLVVPVAAAAAIGIVGLLLRDRARARRLEREVGRRLRLGPSGIVIGAEPETLIGSSTHAVLVVHGFGDTPQSVRELAHYLHARGFTVEVPLLPGHGRTLTEFGLARAHDWIGNIRDQVARLRRMYAHVSLVGLSMGAALCAIVAAERDDIDALVMLSPYLNMPTHVRRIARLLKISGPLAPFRKSAGRTASILNPAAQPASRGLGVVSGRLLAELYDVTVVAQESLPYIDVPTLYMASRQDSRVPQVDALTGWEAIHAPQRAFHWMEHSGHIMTVDYEKDAVFRDVAAWLERFK